MIIFSEDEHYNNLMQNGFEKYPNKRDLTILGKRWLITGYKLSELKDKIIEYCKMFYSEFSPVKSENLINSVISTLESGEIPDYFNDTEIVLYSNEIERIKRIPNKDSQKVAFIILCLAKWNKSNNIYLNSKSLIKISDIFNLSQLKCSKKSQYAILKELSDNQFINVKMKPLLMCEIPVLQNENSGESYKARMSSNIIQVWYDIIYPHCCICGKGFEKKSNSQKYCKKCAIQIKNRK